MHPRSLLLLLFVLSAAAPIRAQILIEHVTVIDGTGAPAQRDVNVLIMGNRIAAIGRKVSAASHVHRISGRGKFLIPGLWDAHVHLWYAESLPLYLASGVTTVRDMGSDWKRTRGWRDDVDAGRRSGPRIFSPGAAVVGPDSKNVPDLPVLRVKTAADGRRVVEELTDQRVDFIKVLSDVPRDGYIALAERARQFRMPFAGHLPDSISAWEAIDARQRSIEHLFGIMLACSSREDELRLWRVRVIASGDAAQRREYSEQLLGTYSAERAQLLFDRMARYSVTQVPTLTLLRRMYYLDVDRLTSDPRMQVVPATVRKSWEDPRLEAKQLAPGLPALLARQYERSAAMVEAMQKAGVNVVAGTDTGDPYTIPGASLHDELALLVDAGLTPMQALQSATRNAARLLDEEKTLGTIEPGKIADVVLLNADPLASIRNTEKIDLVIVRGRIHQSPGRSVPTPPAP